MPKRPNEEPKERKNTREHSQVVFDIFLLDLVKIPREQQVNFVLQGPTIETPEQMEWVLERVHEGNKAAIRKAYPQLNEAAQKELRLEDMIAEGEFYNTTMEVARLSITTLLPILPGEEEKFADYLGTLPKNCRFPLIQEFPDRLSILELVMKQLTPEECMALVSAHPDKISDSQAVCGIVKFLPVKHQAQFVEQYFRPIDFTEVRWLVEAVDQPRGLEFAQKYLMVRPEALAVKEDRVTEAALQGFLKALVKTNPDQQLSFVLSGPKLTTLEGLGQILSVVSPDTRYEIALHYSKDLSIPLPNVPAGLDPYRDVLVISQAQKDIATSLDEGDEEGFANYLKKLDSNLRFPLVLMYPDRLSTLELVMPHLSPEERVALAGVYPDKISESDTVCGIVELLPVAHQAQFIAKYFNPRDLTDVWRLWKSVDKSLELEFAQKYLMLRSEAPAAEQEGAAKPESTVVSQPVQLTQQELLLASREILPLAPPFLNYVSQPPVSGFPIAPAAPETPTPP